MSNLLTRHGLLSVGVGESPVSEVGYFEFKVNTTNTNNAWIETPQATTDATTKVKCYKDGVLTNEYTGVATQINRLIPVTANALHRVEYTHCRLCLQRIPTDCSKLTYLDLRNLSPYNQFALWKCPTNVSTANFYMPDVKFIHSFNVTDMHYNAVGWTRSYVNSDGSLGSSFTWYGGGIAFDFTDGTPGFGTTVTIPSNFEGMIVLNASSRITTLNFGSRSDMNNTYLNPLSVISGKSVSQISTFIGTLPQCTDNSSVLVLNTASTYTQTNLATLYTVANNRGWKLAVQ